MAEQKAARQTVGMQETPAERCRAEGSSNYRQSAGRLEQGEQAAMNLYSAAATCGEKEMHRVKRGHAETNRAMQGRGAQRPVEPVSVRCSQSGLPCAPARGARGGGGGQAKEMPFRYKQKQPGPALPGGGGVIHGSAPSPLPAAYVGGARGALGTWLPHPPSCERPTRTCPVWMASPLD